MSDMVLFTDLDGSLLDHDTYSVRAALPAMDLLLRRKIPVVPVSSKTAAEIRRWARLLDLSGPFVSENGCGIHYPQGYFKADPPSAVRQGREWKISLGIDIEDVKQALKKLANVEEFQYRTFDQMSTDELSALTDLTAEELVMALKREHDLPFIILGDHCPDRIREQAASMEFHFTRGGRFYHLAGGCDKGKAVRALTDLYKEEMNAPLFISIGDSFNDLPMFEETDLAFLVQKPDGSYDPLIPDSTARKVRGVGPVGWRAAVEEVMAHWITR